MSRQMQIIRQIRVIYIDFKNYFPNQFHAVFDNFFFLKYQRFLHVFHFLYTQNIY